MNHGKIGVAMVGLVIAITAHNPLHFYTKRVRRGGIMVTMGDVQFQMRLLGYSGFSLRRGEVRELPELLWEDEHIQQAIYGRHSSGFGMMVATDRRLLFVDRRFFHRHFIDIPYDNINSVELDFSLFNGSVTIHARTGETTLRGMSVKRAREFFNYVDGHIKHED